MTKICALASRLLPHHWSVPRYDARCETHGLFEVIRPISQASEPFACATPGCGLEATQSFSPEHVHHARIDDMASVGHDRTDPRTRDVNLGLGGTYVTVGQRADGTAIKEYRPTTNAEASSNKRAREIARSQGLTPADNGRYRSTR